MFNEYKWHPSEIATVLESQRTRGKMLGWVWLQFLHRNNIIMLSSGKAGQNILMNIFPKIERWGLLADRYGLPIRDCWQTVRSANKGKVQKKMGWYLGHKGLLAPPPPSQCAHVACFCTFFKIFHVRLGKKTKTVSFYSGVCMCKGKTNTC